MKHRIFNVNFDLKALKVSNTGYEENILWDANRPLNRSSKFKVENLALQETKTMNR